MNIPLTPSRYHEQARKRPHTHDRIQEDFLAFLRGRQVVPCWPSGATTQRHVEGEYPILRNGQVVSFADAAEILTVDLTTIVSLYEIKPRIETVYGVVRQLKSMLALAEAHIPGNQHWVHAVVPHDDPALPALREEWPFTWAWGVAFEDCEE